VAAASSYKLKQARERLQQGDIASAQSLCQQVLRNAPRNPEALCLLAMSRLMSGQPEEAVPLFEQALSSDPRNGMALEHLGLAHLMLGRHAEAETVLRRAVALPGAPASVAMRLGVALTGEQRYEEGIRYLKQALSRDPENVDCLLNLAHALARVGDIPAAETQLDAVLRLSPDNVDAKVNHGVMALERGESEIAEKWFRSALDVQPRSVDAITGLGLVFQKRQALQDAADCFRRALAIDAEFASARNNLACTLLLQGRARDAREQYHHALRINPGMIEAREGLASACLALGRYSEAAQHLRAVVNADPQNAVAWSALADALFQGGELDDAESAATRARSLNGESPLPYSALALIHIVRGDHSAAIAVLEEGFGRTGSGGLLGMLVHQLRRVCDWAKWEPAWAELARRLNHEPELGSPFWLLLEDATPAGQLSYTRRWAERNFAGSKSKNAGRNPVRSDKARRIRIGYLSSEFHEHAIAYLFAGILEAHDRDHFEIFAYSYGPEDQSAMRERLRSASEHFIDVAREADDMVVKRLVEADLDILVDLKGYTLGARTNILAQRPCAIQVNWLGYPGTMGADFIDYLITDPFIVPPEQQNSYSEQILYLSHCWQCNDRSRPQIEPRQRAEYGLPENAFVYCCFTQSVKITPEIFARWMSLLKRVPASVLWLAEDNRWATENLIKHAQQHGIAPDRLVFSPRLRFAQHLARYRVADLALDTYPYTSHSTASDALWSGCPMVALCGETFAARVSGSILTYANLAELITYSLDEYEALALRMATDAAFRNDMRLRVAQCRASPLFDAESFTRDLEAIYERLASPQA